MNNINSKSIICLTMLFIMLLFSTVFAVEYEYVNVNLSVEFYNSGPLKKGVMIENVTPGQKFTISASCDNAEAIQWSTNSTYMQSMGFTTNNKGLAFTSYMFDSTNTSDYKRLSSPAGGEITIPNFEPGSTHYLVVEAVAANDGLVKNGKEVEAVSGSFNVWFTMKSETKATVIETITKKNESTLTLRATVTDGVFKQHVYAWDNGIKTTTTLNPADVEIPMDGERHVLTAIGYAEDGTSHETTYVFEPSLEVVVDTKDLIVENWMKENSSLEVLAVSLRNDSNRYSKLNKNIYQLDEEIVYYVDFKNGEEKIDKEVKLELQLPLEFKVINSAGGIVDKDDRTISWRFDGLKAGASGTMVVKVSYTALTNRRSNSEMIYPKATIGFSSTKNPKDTSSVINLIYASKDVDMEEEHVPYMLGDLESPTFRPDDGISRAEGALVLARIFGISYSGTHVEGNEFSDIKTTYMEAQKAIVASTKIGLIAGFQDGTYRPNEKMTKSQFMKIIASYVEVKAKEDGIEGLEIKDLEKSIKIYKNPISSKSGKTTYASDHWAVPYITLLIRLNMTPVSNSNLSLGLDEEITRAEVAQLVNYYLFRTPANDEKTDFEDVSKKHKLYGDIVEATMPAHTYSFTSDTSEVRKAY